MAESASTASPLQRGPARPYRVPLTSTARPESVITGLPSADQPGVLADLTRILADSGISIDAMMQKEPGEGEIQADIIMLTHQTQEKKVLAAIARMEGLPTVLGNVTKIRLENLS